MVFGLGAEGISDVVATSAGPPGARTGGRRRGDPARPGLFLPERPAPGRTGPARRGRPIHPAGGDPQPGQRARGAARPQLRRRPGRAAAVGARTWPTLTATTGVARSRTSRRTCGPIPRSTGSTATSSTRWPTGPKPPSLPVNPPAVPPDRSPAASRGQSGHLLRCRNTGHGRHAGDLRGLGGTSPATNPRRRCPGSPASRRDDSPRWSTTCPCRRRSRGPVPGHPVRPARSTSPIRRCRTPISASPRLGRPGRRGPGDERAAQGRARPRRRGPDRSEGRLPVDPIRTIPPSASGCSRNRPYRPGELYRDRAGISPASGPA